MPRNRRNLDPSLIIAPARNGGKWTVQNWMNIQFVTEDDWKSATEIFEDRMNFRYMNVIKTIDSHSMFSGFSVMSLACMFIDSHSMFSGFSVMSLACMFIETLAQFYAGLNSSEDATFSCGHSMNNTEFYINFLTRHSFVFSQQFNEQQALIFYRDIRCGLLHACETGGNSKIKLRNGDLLFRQTGGSMTIYRRKFVTVLQKEFETYCVHLLKNDSRAELRHNFRNKMNFICGLPEFEQ